MVQPTLTLKIPPIPVEQIFAQFQEQVDKVGAFLPALDAGEGPDENCYRWIFKGLLMETRDGFVNAVEAWRASDYRRLAWATRSLVELKIWTKYVMETVKRSGVQGLSCWFHGIEATSSRKSSRKTLGSNWLATRSVRRTLAGSRIPSTEHLVQLVVEHLGAGL
jgi:hypothetical protein